MKAVNWQYGEAAEQGSSIAESCRSAFPPMCVGGDTVKRLTDLPTLIVEFFLSRAKGRGVKKL